MRFSPQLPETELERVWGQWQCISISGPVPTQVLSKERRIIGIWDPTLTTLGLFSRVGTRRAKLLRKQGKPFSGRIRSDGSARIIRRWWWRQFSAHLYPRWLSIMAAIVQMWADAARPQWVRQTGAAARPRGGLMVSGISGIEPSWCIVLQQLF